MAENVAIFWQIITNSSNSFLSSHEYKITILKLMTASSNISPASSKKKSKKNKDNFVKIEFEVHNLT